MHLSGSLTPCWNDIYPHTCVRVGGAGDGDEHSAVSLVVYEPERQQGWTEIEGAGRGGSMLLYLFSPWRDWSFVALPPTWPTHTQMHGSGRVCLTQNTTPLPNTNTNTTQHSLHSRSIPQPHTLTHSHSRTHIGGGWHHPKHFTAAGGD